MSKDRSRECQYGKCFRYRESPIHGGEWKCKRCAKDGGHVAWYYYLSPDRWSPKLRHHTFVPSYVMGKTLVPDYELTVPGPPPGHIPEGVTFDD
jgi:hypothetical protein